MDTKETKKQGFFATCPPITHYFYFPLSHPYLVITEGLLLILSLSWIAYCVTRFDIELVHDPEFEKMMLIINLSLYVFPILYVVWGFTIVLRTLLTLSHWIGSIRHDR